MKNPNHHFIKGYFKGVSKGVAHNLVSIFFTFITVFLIPLFFATSMAMESSLLEKEQENSYEEFLSFRISKPLLSVALQPRTLSFERLEFLGAASS